MNEKKFDPKKLKKLNNPQRLKDIPPDWIWAELKLDTADTMVEIGAGTAFFCIAFFKAVNPARIYACDISETMLDWVRNNVIGDYPGIIPVKTEENAVPLEDNCSDVVFMICLHHELDNPDRVLKESYRILKPGGKIFIVDWKKQEMPDGPPMEIRCLPEEVSGQMVSAGFKHVHITGELTKHFLVLGEK